MAQTGLFGRALRATTRPQALAQRLGPAFSPWWCLGGATKAFSLGTRLHQGLTRLGGALVDGKPPRLVFLAVTLKNKEDLFESRGVLTSGHIYCG